MHSASNLIIDTEIKDSFKIIPLQGTAGNGSSCMSVTCNRIFVLTEAAGSIQTDDLTHTITGKEVFLIAKGQVFAFNGETSLSGFEIIFGDCFWERTPASASNCKAVLFNHITLHQRLALKESDATDLLPVCQMLLQEYEKEDYPNKLDAMAAYLKILMIKLANRQAASDGGFNDYDNRLYQRFLELVSVKYNHTREVADFARELAVSPRKLSDLCKQKSGYGAKEIINGYLIAEAKRSLQFTAKPIKEIAYDLSFATPEQFSHFFKKNTNASPADYRTIFVNIGR